MEFDAIDDVRTRLEKDLRDGHDMTIVTRAGWRISAAKTADIDAARSFVLISAAEIVRPDGGLAKESGSAVIPIAAIDFWFEN